MNETNNYIDEEELEGTKIGRYDISSYTIDKPIETLIKWKRNKKMIVPDFQRDYVWKYNTACKLIDSVLLNLPIPGIFVCRRIINFEEKYYLIDGLQRLTTLEQFYDGEYISQEQNLKKQFIITTKSSDWYKKKYNDLTEIEQENFKDYSISLTVFEISEKNEAKNLNSMYEIFERINTGSEKLTSQEIRNAIFSGPFLNKIKEYCNNSCSFKRLLEKDNNIFKRKKDQELVLRFLTYYHIYKRFSDGKNDMIDGHQKITSSKIESLNNYLYNANKNTILCDEEFSDVVEALEIISEFDLTAFYGLKRDVKEISNTIHEVFAEALVIALIKNNFKINITSEEFVSWKISFIGTENFYNFFVESTTSKNNIIGRVNIIGDVLNGKF